LSSQQPERPARYFINVVSIRTLPEDKTTSTNSSTGSIPTEILRPEDDDYNLDLTPLGFSRFRFFHPDEVIWSSTSATTNQSSMEKPMSKGSSASSTTLIGVSDEQMRSNAS